MTTRKEAEVLTFPKFGTTSSFAEDWVEARREVKMKSARSKGGLSRKYIFPVLGLWRAKIHTALIMVEIYTREVIFPILTT